MRKIENIVFYKNPDKKAEATGACIFYQDGTYQFVSYSDGIDACSQFLNEKGVTSKQAFQAMLNKDSIYVMSIEDLMKRFNSFIPQDNLTKSSISDVIGQTIENPELHEVEVKRNIEVKSSLPESVEAVGDRHAAVKEALSSNRERIKQRRKATTEKKLVKSARALNLTQDQYQEIMFAVRKPTILKAILATKGLSDITSKRAKDRTEEEKELYSREKENVIHEIAEVIERNPDLSVLDAIESLYSLNVTYRDNGKAPIVKEVVSSRRVEEPVVTENPIMRVHRVEFDEDNVRDLGEDVVVAREKKEGFITRAWNSLKENTGKVLKKVAKVAVYTGAVALAVCGIRSCAKHVSKEGFMFNRNLKNATIEDPVSDDSNLLYLNETYKQNNPYVPTEWFYQTATPTVDSVNIMSDEFLPTATVEVLDHAIEEESTPTAPVNAEPTEVVSNGEGSESMITPTEAATIYTNSCGVVAECPTVPTGFYDEESDTWLVRNNNHYYDNYTYDQLLKVTENETQKRAMMNIKNAIFGFNVTFADAYVEEGKDIRAALTFDEVVALHQAYNDFSKEQLLAIFNGAELNSSKMSNDYKSATLQLMGAHIIENSEHPVDMSMLLETEEGRAFYQRYHAMFLAAKETTGKEQLKNVKAFYDAVRTDFPITMQVRTEGIAHADSYASLDSYKLSVIPMIAASEMLFQNLDVDYTLNDTEVDFFNDIGLCNEAFHSFQRAEMIGLACCPVSCENPLYEQYRNAIIKMLKESGHYVIDDVHRELTKLDAFQEMINKFNIHEGEWVFAGSTYVVTSTYTTVSQWTETHTTYQTVQQRIEAPIPDDERAKIDAQIAAENEAARIEAEAQAEQVAQQLQEAADQHAQQIYQEIEQEAADLQEHIEEANAQIELNHDDDPSNDNPVTEADFGEHNVDFYEQYEDGTGTGTLGDFVENITTDPTGVTYEPLPDPNETGAAFDAAYQDSYSSYGDTGSGAVVENTSSYEAPVTDYTDTSSPYVENVSDSAWIEYPSDYSSYSPPASDYVDTSSYSAPANDYVDSSSSWADTSSSYGYGWADTGSSYGSYDSSSYGWADTGSSYGSYDSSSYGWADTGSSYSPYDTSSYGWTDTGSSYVQYVSDDAWIEIPSDFSSYSSDGEGFEYTR